MQVRFTRRRQSTHPQVYEVSVRLMRWVRGGLLAFLCGASVATATDQAVFQFDGKAVSINDLTTAERQAVYEVHADGYRKLAALAEAAALNQYFNAEVKKTGKSRASLEEAELGVPAPTDKQVSDWFEANKARIPPGYTVDKIAGEIRVVLREQSTQQKREALLSKLKAEKRFALLLVEPQAPLVDLALDGYPILGDAGAKVTIAEFADYQCPHCKTANTALAAFVKKHRAKVKLVFLDYPIKGEFSQLAAYGAFCAGQQGKYWEFHDLAFEKQGTLGNKDAALGLAKELKLDDAKFSTCLTSDAARKLVERSKAEGDKVGLTGTPLIFINGKRTNNFDEAELEKIVKPLL